MPSINFPRPSTRTLIDEARRRPGFTLFDLLHAYVYGRWTHFYIALGSGRHPLARRLAPVINAIGRLLVHTASREGAVKFEDTYHGKVMPLAGARELVSVRENIALGDLEQVIPYARARDLVLNNPDHIIALDCPCRISKPDHCSPVDVCLVIGEPFASFLIEHQPDRARWITPAEAETIIKAEDERGHVHHAFFKDAMLGRFYAICNCCSCCCAALQAHRQGTPMLASSGYIAHVDEALCKSCKKCARVCVFDALTVNGKANVDPLRCMGCGVCAAQCKFDALTLVRAPEKGEPLAVQTLIAEKRLAN